MSRHLNRGPSRLYSSWLKGNLVIYPGSAGPGDEYFVDATDGSDSNDGLSWEKPFLTIATAITAATDGADDYIYARGNFSDSAITINKSKLHLLGMNEGWGKSYITRLNSGASATGATILIQAVDVEIGFLQVIGNRDPGAHYPAIFADGDNSGTRSYLHHLFIPMLTPSGSNYCNGINLLGDRHVVEHVMIESQEVGIRIYSDVQATYEIFLKDIFMYACDVGVDIESINEGTGQHGVMADNLLIDGHGAHTVDVGIKVRSGNPVFRNCDVSAYGTDQAGNYTVGNGKFIHCSWAQTTGYQTALT